MRFLILLIKENLIINRLGCKHKKYLNLRETLMHKNLSKYLLICSAFNFFTPLTYGSDTAATSSAITSSITSAADFFAQAKKSGAKLEQLFQQATPQAKDEIARAVQDPKATAESLGVSPMLFSKLKSNLIISSHTPAASTITTVGALTAERLTIQNNTVGAATGEHRVSREIGRVDASAFTKAEQEAALEAERRATQQKQREEFDAKFANLQREETEARGFLQKDATQVNSSIAQNNVLQGGEITGRVDTTTAENSERGSLQKDFTITNQQLGLQSSESANRDGVSAPEAFERKNLQAAFNQGAFQANELTNRNQAITLEASARQELAKAYAESGLNALAATDRRELQEAETAQRAIDVKNQETAARFQLEVARDQSLKDSKEAEAKRKQREFEAKFADLQSAEVKARQKLEATSKTNELHAQFATERTAINATAQRRAMAAIEAAAIGSRQSIEEELKAGFKALAELQKAIAEKMLLDYADTQRQIALKEQQRQLAELSEKAEAIKNESTIAQETSLAFAKSASETMLAVYRAESAEKREVEQFDKAINGYSFEQIINKIKYFMDKGMLQKELYLTQAFDRILRIHDARLQSLAELSTQISELRRVIG